jgi:pimeloyl-ACP methyl ester carboxylesterase
VAVDKDGNIIRPRLGPSFLEEDDAAPAPGGKRKLRVIRFLGRLLWRALVAGWRVLTYDPLQRKLRIEDGTLVQRTLRGLGYRLFFVPVAIAGIVCLMVWTATHPRLSLGERDPGSTELYYDAVSFVTQDNVRLDGALFPVLDARQVIEEQERALRKRYPAVVLVHDFAMRKDQMLPLVRPLHDAGFVVLAMNLRGNGASGATAQTFGLREALDVKAAVEMLRRRPFVDAARITVVGAGTGATAAMIHAKSDPAISAIVACDPVRHVDTLLDGTLAPRHKLLAWMKPLCKWTFEFAYQLDIDDVSWDEFTAVRQSRAVLELGSEGGHTDFSRPKHVEQIRSFLVHQLVEPKLPVVKAGE